MDVKKFIKPFKGSFIGVKYESAESLFSQFVTETILQRIESERSVFGAKWMKWHRPPRPFHDDRATKAEDMN